MLNWYFDMPDKYAKQWQEFKKLLDKSQREKGENNEKTAYSPKAP